MARVARVSMSRRAASGRGSSPPAGLSPAALVASGPARAKMAGSKRLKCISASIAGLSRAAYTRLPSPRTSPLATLSSRSAVCRLRSAVPLARSRIGCAVAPLASRANCSMLTDCCAGSSRRVASMSSCSCSRGRMTVAARRMGRASRLRSLASKRCNSMMVGSPPPAFSSRRRESVTLSVATFSASGIASAPAALLDAALSRRRCA